MQSILNQSPKFEMEVQSYLIPLKRYCFHLTKSKWDGEDLMQDTLVKAYTSWSHTYRSMSLSYLIRIASNTWIDRHRKRKPKEDRDLDISQLKAKEKSWISDRLYQAMEILLKELSPKQRITFLLMEGFGYTTKEIADMLDESEGSIKAALHRARQRLKLARPYDQNSADDEQILNYIVAWQNQNVARMIHLYQIERLASQSPRRKSKFPPSSQLLLVA